MAEFASTGYNTNADEGLVRRSACMQLFGKGCPEVEEGRVPISNTPMDVRVAELASQGIMPLILDASWKWPSGSKITIKFLDKPSPIVEKKIKQFAESWLPFAKGISFDWVTSGNADVRIALKQGDGSWSYVGTECQKITNQTKPTMNYGWFDDNTEDAEFSRTTTHEFGHMLGCVHEQFSPNLKITWIKSQVYADFLRSDGWDEADVDNNFNDFKPLSGDNFKATAFDPNSIMCYPIQPNWNEEKISVIQKTVLSAVDKSFISQLYPQTMIPRRPVPCQPLPDYLKG